MKSCENLRKTNNGGPSPTSGHVKKELEREPEQSNREIAAKLQASDKRVGEIRAELETKGAIPFVTHTIGQDGKRRPRPKRKAAAIAILPSLQQRYGPKPTPANSQSLLNQLRFAVRSHPLAFLVALPFGGFVPVSVWVLTHLETLHWWHWTMAAGGALSSSLTVIEWGKRILTNTPKAIGFAVLVEGVMITSATQWLSSGRSRRPRSAVAGQDPPSAPREGIDPRWRRRTGTRRHPDHLLHPSRPLEEVCEGTFREDLYYRLNTFPLRVPALRERATDIPLLIEHFAKLLAAQWGARPKRVSPEAFQKQTSYNWPGNVRQLESAIERAVILTDGDLITEKELPEEILHFVPKAVGVGEFDLPLEGVDLEELEKHLIQRAMERSGGVIAKAAPLLGLTYRTLQYRLQKYGVSVGEV